MRLLLAEDDPDNRDVEVTLLKEAGFLVDTIGAILKPRTGDERQHRIIHGMHLVCIMFRHIVHKSSVIHKVLPAVFDRSDENPDCAICAPE